MAPAPPHTWAGVVGEWAAALRRAPQLLATVALRRRSLEDELVAASLRGHLRRALAWWDLLALGVGQAVASGIFTQSGVAANTAGPAVVLSFAFSGAAAAAAAACYAEFAADFPVAGAGLTYTIITLGEAPGEAIEVVPGLRRAPPQPSHQLLRPPPPSPPTHTAWVTLANLLCYYELGAAAVARGFSHFLATLCDQPPDLFSVGQCDLMAAGAALTVTLLLSAGVREAAYTTTGACVRAHPAAAGWVPGDARSHLQTHTHTRQPWWCCTWCCWRCWRSPRSPQRTPPT